MNEEWRPNIPQEKALRSTAYETLYGGARGGGKTDAGLVWLIKPYLLNNPHCRSLVIRKNSDDLADWVDRASRLYSRYGAVVTGKPPIIRFPSGYKIRTGHLKDDQAYTKYQGQEYQRIVIEELTQIGKEKNYLQLLGSCRSTVQGVDPRIFCTTNPGGIGHSWVKHRFIDASPPGQKFIAGDTGRTRIYIPAKVDDNTHLMENDPNYVKFLEGLKDSDEELWKAWRLGDWDTFAGQFFREFRRDKHVCRMFNPKPELPRTGGMDWGRTDPFCFLAAVVVDIKYTGIDKPNPITNFVKDYTFTRVFVFQEAYGTEKLPREWAQIMNSKCDVGTMQFIECDNQIFNPQNDGSHSIADQFYDYDERFRGKLRMQAHTQLSENKNQRVNRAANVHQWLSLAPDGIPYLLIAENCQNLIRTLPELVHDELNVEDVDCFVKGTMINTPDGERNVENIKVGDLVDTPIGVRRIIKAGISGKSEKVITVYLSNGKRLKGTANHPVFVWGKGIIELQKLNVSDILGEQNTTQLWNENKLFIIMLFIIGIRGDCIMRQMEQCLNWVINSFINKFILTIMDKFRKDIIYIIKILTMITINHQILLLYPHMNMHYFISSEIMPILNKKQNTINGITQKKVKNSLVQTPIKCELIYQKESRYANIVERLLQHNIHNKSFVKNIRNLKGIRRKIVLLMANLFGKRKMVNELLRPVHIVAVGNYEEETVYRLTVEEAHLYYANGVLVSNTQGEDHAYDSLAYMLKAIRWVDARLGAVNPKVEPEKERQHFAEKPIPLSEWSNV